MNSKTNELLRLSLKSPMELYTRIDTFVEGISDSLSLQKSGYSNETWDNAVGTLDAFFSGAIQEAIAEPQLLEVEQEVKAKLEHLNRTGPFGSFHNGDFALGRACYALARHLRPSIVIETGVCYGVTSAYVLAALAKNGHGTLHSIDLPPLARDGDLFVGILIPQRLRQPWQLHRGTSKRLLPHLLKHAGGVNLFIHDSLHTYRNIRRELESVTPFLSSTSAVVVDDIEGNAAFGEWLARNPPAVSTIVRENSKQSLLGVAVFLPAAP